MDIINSVSQRDKIKIVLQDETEQVYDFSLGNEEDYKGFINDTLEDEIINVKVKIDKEVVNNHFLFMHLMNLLKIYFLCL